MFPGVLILLLPKIVILLFPDFLTLIFLWSSVRPGPAEAAHLLAQATVVSYTTIDLPPGASTLGVTLYRGPPEPGGGASFFFGFRPVPPTVPPGVQPPAGRDARGTPEFVF